MDLHLRLTKTLPIAALAMVMACGTAVSATNDAASHKPLIGINVDVSEEKKKEASIPSAYYEAINKSGGIPILIPPMPAESLDTVLKGLDGVVMIGGEDYPPSLYNQKAHPSTVIMHEDRSNFDMTLVRAILKEKDLPFLGICAGCQALNIASGGSLIQDIPSHNPQSKVGHCAPSGWHSGHHMHPVKLNQGSKIASIMKTTELTVPSSHHQCVDQVGKGLHAVAAADDGLTEAIEGNGDRFLVGLQWHPEKDFANNQAIFAALIEQAKAHQSGREHGSLTAGSNVKNDSEQAAVR